MTYVDFDCRITLYPETPTKIKQINRERNFISRSCEKAKCLPSSDQHNCSMDEQPSSNIFLKPYNSWDIVPATLMSVNHAKGRYSLCNHYDQPTSHQP